MHTLFDFITHIKGVEYIAAVLFIGGYILYWEFLKPRPFQTVREYGRSDLDYVRKEGVGKHLGRAVTAPFVGLAYVIALPFVFFFALGYSILAGIARLAGSTATFGWRPAESYLGGKKKTQDKAGKDAPKDETVSGDAIK